MCFLFFFNVARSCPKKQTTNATSNKKKKERDREKEKHKIFALYPSSDDLNKRNETKNLGGEKKPTKKTKDGGGCLSRQYCVKTEHFFCTKRRRRPKHRKNNATYFTQYTLRKLS